MRRPRRNQDVTANDLAHAVRILLEPRAADLALDHFTVEGGKVIDADEMILVMGFEVAGRWYTEEVRLSIMVFLHETREALLTNIERECELILRRKHRAILHTPRAPFLNAWTPPKSHQEAAELCLVVADFLEQSGFNHQANAVRRVCTR